MKREDFVIEGIPDGYQVNDVDLTPSGQVVGVLAHLTDDRAEPYILLDQSILSFPNETMWRRASGPFTLPPLVRFTDEGHLVAVKPRVGRTEKISGWVLNMDGSIATTFFAGDGVEDLLASPRRIITSYFDEGVFSGDDPSREGVAVYDSAGEYQWGYQTRIGARAVEISSCYCVCWTGRADELIFSPYREFPLVRLNVGAATQEVWQVPPDLRGPAALTCVGDVIFFYSPYDYRGKVLGWRLGTSDFALAGDYTGTWRPRGLPGGRFIAPKPDGYTILSFD